MTSVYSTNSAKLSSDEPLRRSSVLHTHHVTQHNHALMEAGPNQASLADSTTFVVNVVK